jgi:uncharacterized membrane protein SpoIIM required for sporulation
MKVAELLAERHKNWAELQSLCMYMGGRSKRRMHADTIVRFAALYRAACADLALADAYQLPSNTVAFLHQLVAQAHNLLYRSRTFALREWVREVLFRVPQRIFGDRFLWITALLFFGLFIVSFLLARQSGEFAELKAGGKDNLTAMRDGFRQAPEYGLERTAIEGGGMAGFYVWNNTGIGLRCFSFGMLLFGFGGMFEVVFNAVHLGASFGFMSMQPEAGNFFTFVTAHGPFELTAVVLSGAAGMRMGFALVDTQGLTRGASLRKAGREAMPTMGLAILLFLGAAVLEAFVSRLFIPYWGKAAVSALCAGLLFFYLVILGMPREGAAAPAQTGDGTWESAVKAD